MTHRVPGETHQTYLGDGVYASFDGFQIWLRTSDGKSYTNEVALEPYVVETFIAYIDYLNEFRRSVRSAPVPSDS
jgi:hypothetical protein